MRVWNCHEQEQGMMGTGQVLIFLVHKNPAANEGWLSMKRQGAYGKIYRQWQMVSTLLLISIFAGAAVVCAADAKLTPKVTAGVGYDDNILFTRDEKVDSSILSVRPGIELDYQTLLSRVLLSADWDVLTYFDESGLNRVDQYYSLSGDHRLTQRWTAAADFRFARDTSLNTYLQETGRAIDRVERDYLEAGGEVAYDLTLLSKIAATYRFRTVSYEDAVFTDYDRHTVGLLYERNLKNERDTLSIGPSYYSRTAGGNDVDSYFLDLGWARNWSTVTSSAVTIGARYTKINRADGTEHDKVGPRAGLNITSRGLVSTTVFRYFHELRTTERGQEVNVDNLFLDYRRSITERSGAGFSGRLAFSYKLFDQQANVNDTRFYWLEPRLFYQLTRNMDVSLRYRYQNHIEYFDPGSRTRERNIIWFQISYAMPFAV
jgi:hypothetical protein